MKNHILKSLLLPILFISCGDNIENPDYLNESLPVGTRVDGLMSRMNLYEKTRNLALQNNHCPFQPC